MSFSHPDLLRIIRLKIDLVEKHLQRYEVEPDTGCHIWTGPTIKNKNGMLYSGVSFKIDGVATKVRGHRLSYAYHYGVDPGDLLVCHECDVPICINPDHLFLGTGFDNMQDMHAKGRAANQSGFHNGHCKALPEDIDRVVELLPVMGNKQISDVLDGKLTHSMISRIRLGKSWSDYTGIQPKERAA